MAVKLRSFDAFPKVAPATMGPGETPPLAANMMSWITTLAMLFIFWLQTTAWMGAHEDYQFSVDKGMSETLQVNLDITVFAHCEYLDVFIYDEAEDRLMVRELVEMRNVDQGEGSWCRIGGSFNTNRVRGRLVISPIGAGFYQRHQTPIDWTHWISELSFGTYYANVMNPLDNTMLKSTSPNDIFGYVLTIVPTQLQALGTTVDTYMYTVSPRKTETLGIRDVPGIYFQYDFDPIHMKIIDSRMSFIQWLLRLVNIVGGLAILSSWAIREVKRRKEAETDGLLDQHVKA